MSTAGRRRFAFVVAIAGSVVLVGAQLAILRSGVHVRGDLPATVVVTALTILLFGAFFGVGGLLSVRRPRHPVGWLLLAIGVLGATLSLGGLIHGLATDPWLRSLGAWLDAGLWHPSFPVLGLLFLLFPTGAPPTPRWSWLQTALVTAWTFLLVTAPLTTPGLLTEFYPDAGPLIPGPWSEVLVLPHDTVQMSVFPLLLASAVAMLVRAVRSRGLERQQMKWFGASVVVIVIMFPISLLWLGNGALGVAFFALLPVACAVAIMRYRLYEIERLISRTVTYVLVVGALALIYVVGVIVIQVVVPASGDLAVAASTLAVAAAFNPLRRRLRDLVNRRFNRAAYRIDEVADEFSRRLRDRVDAEVVSADLIEIVQRTLAPSVAAVWVYDRSAG